MGKPIGWAPPPKVNMRSTKAAASDAKKKVGWLGGKTVKPGMKLSYVDPHTLRKQVLTVSSIQDGNIYASGKRGAQYTVVEPKDKSSQDPETVIAYSQRGGRPSMNPRNPRFKKGSFQVEEVEESWDDESDVYELGEDELILPAVYTEAARGQQARMDFYDGQNAARAVSGVVLKGWKKRPADMKGWVRLAKEYVDMPDGNPSTSWRKGFESGLRGQRMLEAVVKKDIRIAGGEVIPKGSKVEIQEAGKMTGVTFGEKKVRIPTKVLDRYIDQD